MNRRLAVVWLLFLLAATAHGAVVNPAGRPSALYPYQNSIELADDFMTGGTGSGSVGSLGWSTAGIIGTIPGGDTPGIVTIATGAVSGTIGRINLFGGQPFNAGLPHTVLYRAKVLHNDSNTTVRLGALDNANANMPSNGLYFEKLDTDTFWHCVARKDNAETVVDSGVPVSVANFDTFAYDRTPTGVTWAINGQPVCGTITANVPTGGAGFVVSIVSSAAESKSIYVDYAQFSLIVSR